MSALAGGAITRPGKGGGFNDVAFAPDGRMVATAEDDGYVRLWTVVHDIAITYELDAGIQPAPCVAFDSSGKMLAFAEADDSINLWNVVAGRSVGSLANGASVLTVAFHPEGKLASASKDRTIKLWDARQHRLLLTLEGHTDAIPALSFIAGGSVLASGSDDGSVRLWDSETGEMLATIEDRAIALWQIGLAFHPKLPRLACISPDGDSIDILELDLETLRARTPRRSVSYTSAKIVLVGDSGVGKTGLGWRLAHNEFIEHASTHGQQFWLLDRLGANREDGAQCEAVLWDLAGQPDYRLIHALFLDDADLALLLFDPTRDDDPLHGVDYWLRQLGIGSGSELGHGPRAILVAARADRGAPRLAEDEIESFCVERGISAFVTTSARTGQGLDQLVLDMRTAIAWDARSTTVTTNTFKQIKDYVLGLKERGDEARVIVSWQELRQHLEHAEVGASFSDHELRSALEHLSNHGYVTRLRTSEGEERILLAPDLLNNVASSIVLEARRNPKGLGSLEEQLVLSGGYRFHELRALSKADRDVLLDAAFAMFLKHNVCFRETDPLSSRVYLVFPELINLKRRPTVNDQAVADGVAYTASGAVENLYASLVVLLGYTSTFTRISQWRNHAHYVVGHGLLCGFRLEAEREGELDFVLYFGTTVGAPVRTLFQSLFESYLARGKITVRRLEPVICASGHEIHRTVVREQVAKGNAYGYCPQCGKSVFLPTSDSPSVFTAKETTGLRIQRLEIARRARFEQAAFRLSAYVIQENLPAPSCFVSYSWGDPQHERWVEILADDLVKTGVRAILDRWELPAGTSVRRFVDRIEQSDRVLVVGTPLYRTKYDNDKPMGGFVVAAEGDLIGARMLGSERDKRRVLPVLRDGDARQSFPPMLHGRAYADFRDPDQYYPNVLALASALYEIPARHPIAAELDRLLEAESA